MICCYTGGFVVTNLVFRINMQVYSLHTVDYKPVKRWYKLGAF